MEQVVDGYLLHVLGLSSNEANKTRYFYKPKPYIVIKLAVFASDYFLERFADYSADNIIL